MRIAVPVAAPPSKPVLIFDGDCGFCAFWIGRWQKRSGGLAQYLPFQDPRVAAQFPELKREDFEKAVHLVECDGAVSSGAEAVLRCRALDPARQRLFRWYQKSPGFAWVAERAYRFVAGHRPLFSTMTRLWWRRSYQRDADK